MGVKVRRVKRLRLLVRLAYLLNRTPPRSKVSKLSILLDLEWMFGRLCHEVSYAAFSNSEQPSRPTT